MSQETKHTLPKLADLHHDIEAAFKNDELNLLLNQPVPPNWVRKHPTATKKDAVGMTVPTEYIPIDKIEYLLTRIFQEWEVEVLSEGVMFQSVYVKIRLKVLNPITGQWRSHDGLGACGVQTDAGKSAADLSAIKHAAVQMALPAAKSYAIKDAAEHLGALFGRDLNRKDVIQFEGNYKATASDEKKAAYEAKLAEIKEG